MERRARSPRTPPKASGTSPIKVSHSAYVKLAQSMYALAAQNTVVGYLGTGTFSQNGGSHTTSSRLYLGDQGGSHGAYDLSGTGQLTTTSTSSAR